MGQTVIKRLYCYTFQMTDDLGDLVDGGSEIQCRDTFRIEDFQIHYFPTFDDFYRAYDDPNSKIQDNPNVAVMIDGGATKRNIDMQGLIAINGGIFRHDITADYVLKGFGISNGNLWGKKAVWIGTENANNVFIGPNKTPYDFHAEFGTDERNQKFESIQAAFKFYKNTEDLVRSYNLGQIDGFGVATAESFSENNVVIRNTMHYLESPRYYAVFINQSLAPEEFKELEVREALSATTDRGRIINEVFMSQALPMQGPTSISESLIEEFDPLLLEGLEINLTVPEEDFLVKTAGILKENWESHGATVNVLIFSLKNIQENVLKNSDYEFILFGNITKENQDLFAFWHSSRRFYPDQNLALYQDNTVDTLLETFRKTFDEDKRFEILEAISSTITGDVPAVFLYSPKYVYVTAPRLGGFDESTIMNTSDNRFKDVHKWYVKTKRAFGSQPEIDPDSSRSS